MSYKIFSYLDEITDAYEEPVSILDGLTFNHKETLRTIEFYSNNQYLSGNKDALGREKPFYNVCNYRVTVAKTATDLDVKDIKYEPDSLNDSVATMLINHELFKYLKEINFSKTLNDMGLTRPKYGGLLVKQNEDTIDVVDWKNVEVDPATIIDNVIIETHYLQPSELAAKSDVWENVDEALEEFAKQNKGKPGRIEIKEISGEMPDSLYKECYMEKYKATKKDQNTYKRMCFYIACFGDKKVLLSCEYEKTSRYKYLPWDKIPGRGLGRGIVEGGFEAQTWTNDAIISAKTATDLTTKVILNTTSKKVSGNAITGVNNGHIFELEPNATMTALNLGPSKLPEITNIVDLWNTQYDRESSTYNANTGEAPTAGTPYSQTALLNQVANSPFEYQREVWGIFLNEILNDWIFPELKRRIMKPHYLVSEYSQEELKIIDEAIKIREGNKLVKKELLEGEGIPSPYQMDSIDASVDKSLENNANKREIYIPEDFLDIKGKITANITGELKNKYALLQSLAQIGRDITATFNPQTGQYAAMENPFLRKLYGSIINLTGTSMSAADLKPSPTGTSPVVQPSPAESAAPAPAAPALPLTA